ncbi:MAG TPA: cob(I)yrinic acid a,c-diamide adenosyltransferase [Candidatus Wallbacteria bacterium]|nr:cob(I)yrinic acid a,c-diamide adenosyltransferase [Candidatus Wallbacteria bacterium]
MNIEKGLIQVYTGNGKGKTTAAFGLALRARGHGFAVKIIQFMKSEKMFDAYGEIKFFKNDPGIEILQFGTDGWVDLKNPAPQAVAAAEKAAEKAADILKNDNIDILILDEILYAYKFNLIKKEHFDKIFDAKKDNTELVLTGRDAPGFIIEKADLVSEIKDVKHYFQSRKAVTGIEF